MEGFLPPHNAEEEALESRMLTNPLSGHDNGEEPWKGRKYFSADHVLIFPSTLLLLLG
jgi:hypothetical protein